MPTDLQKLRVDMEGTTKSLALLESVVQKDSNEMNDKINEMLSTSFNLLETVKNEFEDRLRKLEQGTLILDFLNSP